MNFISKRFLEFYLLIFSLYWILYWLQYWEPFRVYSRWSSRWLYRISSPLFFWKPFRWLCRVTYRALYRRYTHCFQNLLLLIGSYYFYGKWDARFLSLLFISSVVDYCCGLLIDKDHQYSKRTRKWALAFSMVVNLGMLGVFKYYDFFATSLQELVISLGGGDVHPFLLDITLPVGISFYTFQTMSYTIDVYRGNLKSTRRFLDFMLYVSFFPQLVAGPIERASHLLPEILNKRRFSWKMISSGTQLALVGFFKKMVIADNLAIIVNDIFKETSPEGFSQDGLTILLGTYAFAFQIYCDFSGYTDIARGISRMLGFELCLNFRLPYFATSPSEFWQRWHISLSAWLRDYLYVPLGGNRGGTLMMYRNLALTMLLGGLWHGAQMHFVVWGIYQGLLLILFRLLTKPTPSKDAYQPKRGVVFWMKVILYFQLTCYGWLIFRASDMSVIFRMTKDLLNYSNWRLTNIPLLIEVAVIVLPFVGFQVYQYYKDEMETWTKWSIPMRVLFYLVLFYAIVLFGTPITSEFIYFQF